MVNDNVTNYKYYAFISYNHNDAKVASWLHKKLESYKLPAEVHNELDDGQRFLRPIFRDKDELDAGILVNALRKKLEDSKYLIVICSKNSEKSEWVSNEVKAFIEMGRLDNIIPLIIEDDLCFPRSLKEYIADHPHEELLGVSIPEVGREKAFARIVSKMLNISFSQIWDRHKRQQRKLNIIKRISAVSVFAFISLFFAVVWTNNVKLREQKKQMLMNQSRYVAEEARNLALEGNVQAAIRILMHVLPLGSEKGKVYTKEAAAALSDIVFNNRVQIDSFSRVATFNANEVIRRDDSMNYFWLRESDYSYGIYDAGSGRLMEHVDGNTQIIWEAFDEDDIRENYTKLEDGFRFFVYESKWNEQGNEIDVLDTEELFENISDDELYVDMCKQRGNCLFVEIRSRRDFRKCTRIRYDLKTKERLREDCPSTHVRTFDDEYALIIDDGDNAPIGAIYNKNLVRVSRPSCNITAYDSNSKTAAGCERGDIVLFTYTDGQVREKRLTGRNACLVELAPGGQSLCYVDAFDKLYYWELGCANPAFVKELSRTVLTDDLAYDIYPFASNSVLIFSLDECELYHKNDRDTFAADFNDNRAWMKDYYSGYCSAVCPDYSSVVHYNFWDNKLFFSTKSKTLELSSPQGIRQVNHIAFVGNSYFLVSIYDSDWAPKTLIYDVESMTIVKTLDRAYTGISPDLKYAVTDENDGYCSNVYITNLEDDSIEEYNFPGDEIGTAIGSGGRILVYGRGVKPFVCFVESGSMDIPTVINFPDVMSFDLTKYMFVLPQNDFSDVKIGIGNLLDKTISFVSIPGSSMYQFTFPYRTENLRIGMNGNLYFDTDNNPVVSLEQSEYLEDGSMVSEHVCRKYYDYESIIKHYREYFSEYELTEAELDRYHLL